MGIIESFDVIAQAAPLLDAAQVVRIVSRMLHILGAVIIGGGLFYIRSILSPAAGADACFAGRRVVWARWVGLATLLLLASGIYNFIVILQQSKQPGATPLSPAYHALFGIKTILALVVMFVAAILAGRTAAAERARANMRLWLNIGWTCVLAIIAIGAVLRSLH